MSQRTEAATSQEHLSDEEQFWSSVADGAGGFDDPAGVVGEAAAEAREKARRARRTDPTAANRVG